MTSLRSLSAGENGSVLVDFGNWWHAELRRLFSRKNSEDSALSANPVIHIGKDDYRLRPTGEAGDLQDMITALTRLRTSGRVRSSSVDVVIGIERSVERSLSLLRLPSSSAIAMAQLDVEAATPFKPEDVFTCLETRARGSGARRYFLIRRNVVQPLQEALGASGFKISGVHVDTPSGLVAIDLADAGGRPDWRRVGTVALAASAVCLLIFSGSTIWLRAHTANRILQEKVTLVAADVAKLKPEFQKQRQAETLLTELQARERGTTTVTEILQTLTSTLPDETYLESIVIDGENLTIAGYSSDAPPLIALLEKDAMFSGVSFSAPTSKIPGKQGDRFEVGMRRSR